MVKPLSQKKKSNKPFVQSARFTVLIFISVFIISLIYCVVWANWRGSPSEIISIADKFKPDTSWKLISNTVDPPGGFCVYTCPHVYRKWSLPAKLTREQFENIAKIDGKKMPITDEGYCFITFPNGVISQSCQKTIIINQYRIQLGYDANNPDDVSSPIGGVPTLSLDVMRG